MAMKYVKDEYLIRIDKLGLDANNFINVTIDNGLKEKEKDVKKDDIRT